MQLQPQISATLYSTPVPALIGSSGVDEKLQQALTVIQQHSARIALIENERAKLATQAEHALTLSDAAKLQALRVIAAALRSHPVA